MAEATATIKFIRISPRKMALLARAIKGQSLTRAEWIIKDSQLSSESYFNHALTNATAMLKQKGTTTSELWVKNAIVDQASRLKRHRPTQRGRALPFQHVASHLQVTLTDENPIKKQEEKNGPKG